MINDETLKQKDKLHVSYKKKKNNKMIEWNNY